MSTETPDSKSLIAEWRELIAAKEPAPSATEKAESLREYQKLVDQIDDVLKEKVRRGHSS
jgi:hypothetical protein